MLCMQPCNNEREVLKTLLKSGADMNTQVNKDGDALQATISSSSAHHSQEDVQQSINLLLQNGAEADDSGDKYGSALKAA